MIPTSSLTTRTDITSPHLAFCICSKRFHVNSSKQLRFAVVATIYLACSFGSSCIGCSRKCELRLHPSGAPWYLHTDILRVTPDDFLVTPFILSSFFLFFFFGICFAPVLGEALLKHSLIRVHSITLANYISQRDTHSPQKKWRLCYGMV